MTLTWEFYRAYGDTRKPEQGYGLMKKWLDYLHRYVLDEGILMPYTGASRFLGDWATPHGSEYGNIHRWETAFNGLSPVYRDHVGTRTQGRIHQFCQRDNKKKPYLDTGSPGLPILLKYIIEDVERPDLLYACLVRTEQPGYGYFLNEGQTTRPEYWQIMGHDSKIHTCYTSIAGYFTRGIGGIMSDPEKYGMKHFIIKPHLVGDLTFANTTSGSTYGSIKSHWSRSGSAGEFHIEIPVNTMARVYIPAKDVNDVLEAAGRPATGAEGVTYLEKDGVNVVFRVDSGAYDFSSSSVPLAN